MLSNTDCGCGTPAAASHYAATTTAAVAVRPPFCATAGQRACECIQHSTAAPAESLFPTLSTCGHSGDGTCWSRDLPGQLDSAGAKSGRTCQPTHDGEDIFLLRWRFPKGSHGRSPFPIFSISLNDAQHPTIGHGGSPMGSLRYTKSPSSKSSRPHTASREKIGVAGRIDRRQQGLGPKSSSPTPCCFVAPRLPVCTALGMLHQRRGVSTYLCGSIRVAQNPA